MRVSGERVGGPQARLRVLAEGRHYFGASWTGSVSLANAAFVRARRNSAIAVPVSSKTRAWSVGLRLFAFASASIRSRRAA